MCLIERFLFNHQFCAEVMAHVIAGDINFIYQKGEDMLETQNLNNSQEKYRDLARSKLASSLNRLRSGA